MNRALYFDGVDMKAALRAAELRGEKRERARIRRATLSLISTMRSHGWTDYAALMEVALRAPRAKRGGRT